MNEHEVLKINTISEAIQAANLLEGEKNSLEHAIDGVNQALQYR